MTDLRRALRVVAITESGGRGDALVQRVLLAVRGGASSVQVRLKEATAREIADVTAQLVTLLDVPVLVNDRFDIALAAGAAGVHLGADDIRPALVRLRTPPGFIIGASVGCDAEVANALGADYAGIGPVFATGSKSDAGEAIGVDGFAKLCGRVRIPAVAIGGIDANNAASAIRAGAVGVASISAIFGSSEPESAASALSRAI